MWWNNVKARPATTHASTLATPMIMSLEPRMLFDGAVAATVVDAAQADSHATAEAAKVPTTEHAATGSESHPQSDAPATPAPVAVPGQTVVFVDARVKDSADLLKGVAPGTQVVQLDASKDGLQRSAGADRPGHERGRRYPDLRLQHCSRRQRHQLCRLPGATDRARYRCVHQPHWPGRRLDPGNRYRLHRKPYRVVVPVDVGVSVRPGDHYRDQQR